VTDSQMVGQIGEAAVRFAAQLTFGGDVTASGISRRGRMGRLDVGVEVVLAEVEVAAMLALQSVVFLVLFLKQKYLIEIISYRNISNILKGRTSG